MNDSQNLLINNVNNTPTLQIQGDAEYFSGLYENRPVKFVSITLSLLFICVSSVLAYTIIWYERYGTDNKRTLMNKLVSIQREQSFGSCFKKLDHFKTDSILCRTKTV